MNATEPISTPSLSNIENEDPVVKIDGKAKPFHYDPLGRKDFAEALMEKFETLQSGKVIAIDAKWGEGKTWFGKNFQTLLEEKCFRTCWIDTFENDHFDDPFLLISAEIYKLMKQDKKASLGNQFLKTIPKAVGLASKIGINVLGKQLAGMSDFDEQLAEGLGTKYDDLIKTVSENSAKLIEEQIRNYTKKDESIKAFRDALTNYCDSSVVKPVIIFVDELDRCKPTFALAFLERLKHYFNIPNLVFVLLLNQESLCATINKTYGQKIDAEEYLQKFIGIKLALFTPAKKSAILKLIAEPYCSNEKYNAHNWLKRILIDLIDNPSLSISIRQLHQIFSHFWLFPNFDYAFNNSRIDNVWLMALLVIKHCVPVEYKNLQQNNTASIFSKISLVTYLLNKKQAQGTPTQLAEELKLLVDLNDKNAPNWEANMRFWRETSERYFKVIDHLTV